MKIMLAVLAIILMALDAAAAGGKHLVMIDPGHGGDDAGVKITDKLGEKEITLAIALALQKELSKDGKIEVILTRDGDKNVSIEERKKKLEKAKPDIFLSLHINAGFGKSVSGFEIYYPGFKENREQKKSAAKDEKTRYLNESVKLAKLIEKNLNTVFPRKSRGLREADTPVLENLTVPALVVELAFATNPEERKKIQSPQIQAEIARALARSIKSFY